MPRRDKLPWLDFEGQDTVQILACKKTHRIDSLLCALEEGIQLRQDRTPEVTITPEEHTFLAIMALEREVNNGGYHQFFTNSSRRYALTIVDALKTVGCEATAALTQEAIGALNLHPLTVKAIEESIGRRNAKRDNALAALDKRFYRIFEIEAKLFAFVETRTHAFILRETSIAPRQPKRGNEKLIRLEVGLMLAPKCDRTFNAVRKLTAEIAIQEEVEATEQELDGAAYLFLFSSFLREGELKRCEEFAEKAFELAREDTSHCIAQCDWVEALIERSDFSRADEVTLQYLEYLKGDDVANDFIKNRVKFWADTLRRGGTQLRRSRAYFLAKFPDVNLDEPPAPRFQFPEPTRKPSSSRKR